MKKNNEIKEYSKGIQIFYRTIGFVIILVTLIFGAIFGLIKLFS